ncbi:G5 domain-containing protein [Lysinibacillus fusiformis]|uniref:G5 domain-containing protein n=1 Tax=Lysinibacillus fusiformis TaxID=28031 RepID=UPI0019685727|nr:G5 domain-containing protein [Lysinibacillus fusiformis]QSB08371.1 G5 domain-containing protein [Lysinibacillus fusiformis]
MKTYIKIISLFLVIVLIVGFFVPSFVLNDTVFAKEGPESSTIGGIEINDVKTSDLATTLQNAISEWQGEEIEIVSDGISKTIDPKQFVFDTSAAIAQYEMLTKKPWYAFWQKEKIVHIPIPVTVNEVITQQIDEAGIWDTDKTLQKLILQASYLKEHKVEAVINEDSMQTEERIAFQIAELPANSQGVAKIIPLLNDVNLVPNQSISLLTLLGEQAGVVNDAGLDFVASILYSVILQTDYEILERHSQEINPSYLQQGIEADINAALVKDLQFINRSEQLGKMKASMEGNQLKIEVFAAAKDKDITVRVSKDKIVKPRIIYRYSEDLKAGQERVEQEGKEGSRVEVYRSIVENGATEEQFISRDYYAPQNRIVTRSSQEPVTITTPTQNVGAGTSDPDLEVDLDGNGLPDVKPSTPEETKQEDGPEIVYGYYDKGGNFVQTSP